MTPAKAPAKAAAKTAKSSKPGAKSAEKSAANAAEKAKGGHIFIGIGGWTFEPWRGVFYPKGLAHAKELSYASERLTSIEVNGTFYRSQTPATFRKWAGEVPDDFVFALKGPRFATNRRVLKEAGDSINRFLDSGVTELGEHLGPLLWQFAPTKKFDLADFGGFLELLPDKYDGHAIRHVIEVRHESFSTPEFTNLLRTFKMPVVFTDHARYPNIADITGDFVYARLQRGKDTIMTAYPPHEIDEWAGRLRSWANGGAPHDLPLVEKTKTAAPSQPRDVFAYVIHEGKVRAPAGAMALIEKLR
ncbi:MAG: DUF72 domain-containing protein [Xanthobacteraceae bacterium]|jgi:uncharacterized protein YecE (DUF72 family)